MDALRLVFLIVAYAAVSPSETACIRYESGLLTRIRDDYGSFGPVVITRDWVFVGFASDATQGYDAGSVYVFRRASGALPLDESVAWTLHTQLFASDARSLSRFGTSISATADVLAVGSMEYREAAYLFLHDDAGTPDDLSDDMWIEETKLVVPIAAISSTFGVPVKVDGQTLAVCDSYFQETSTSPRGAVFVYYRTGSGTPGDPSDDRWIQGPRLRPSNAPNTFSFGKLIALHDPWLIVSDTFLSKVYVFRRGDRGTPSEPFDDEWVEIHPLEPSMFGESDNFGRGLALGDNWLFVGSADEYGPRKDFTPIYVFRRSDGGTRDDPSDDSWIPHQKLEPKDVAPRVEFGWSIATDGQWIIAGAHNDSVMGDYSGSAYVFQRNDNGTPDDLSDDTWETVYKLLPSDGAAFGRFGSDVSVRENLVGVMSWSDSKSVHLFQLQRRDWVCGDGCCDEGEDYVTCQADCFGCGDGYCLWGENPCSCPADCPGTSCGDGCLSGDETCTSCALDCGELFSVDTPELTGYYSCAWGLCSRESSFDFNKQFLSVSDAWLHVVGSGEDKICAPYEFGLTTYLDGFRAPESIELIVVGAFQADVPVFPTPTVFDGQGTLGLSVGVVSYNCFDIGGSVSDATLWFRAVPASRTTNLLDVATFQRCFQVDEDGADPRCAEFDFDNDLDIDLGDYSRFRMSLGGP